MSRVKTTIPAMPFTAANTDTRRDQIAREPLRSNGTGRGSESQMAPDDDRFLTVTEIARELGVTARALRFYEDKNLITPRRVANTRVYTNRERARMILILRGKRLGFSLREIKEYLDLYDADPVHLTQTRVLLKKIAIRTKKLEEQRLAVDQALKGLKELEIDALAVLENAEREIREGRAAAGHDSGVSRKTPKSISSAARVAAADHEEPHL